MKEALSAAPVLACFSLNAATYVITYASPVVLGAILLQEQVNGERKPIVYISRSLTSTEINQFNQFLFKLDSVRSGCPISQARGSCIKRSSIPDRIGI